MIQCNYSNIELQKLIIRWTANDKTENVQRKLDFVCKSPYSVLSVESENFRPKPYYYNNENESICVFGNPIINEKIDRKSTAQSYLAKEANKTFLQSLNGEFLIVHFDKRKNVITVVNDRFTSIPFYYYCRNGVLIGSFAYNDLWLLLQQMEALKVRDETFFEMLWLRRVLGTKTLDKHSLFLPAAHCLVYDGKTVQLKPYWSPDYTKDYSSSVKDHSIRLAEAIKRSIVRKTSDRKKYGLFLSGGMDSRTILSAFDSPPCCFTATYNKTNNREYEVTRELTRVKGAKHIHLQIPPDHFSNILNNAVKLSGGMYEANSIFMGFRDVVASEVDVAFHGHGFDYMFQGMYVPAKNYQIFSKTLKFRRLAPLGIDLVSEFLYKVSYRLKFPCLLDFVREEYRSHLMESLNEEVHKLLSQARMLSDDPYDHWEYLTFHALSRHYSYSDHTSIHTNVEQRTASFDNDIYNIYLSLPVEKRFDARVLRRSLRYLNRQLANVRNANDNYPVASSYAKTCYQLNDYLLKTVRFKNRSSYVPVHLIRTWPSFEWVIRNEKKINNIAHNLSNSTALEMLPWLDLEKIGQQISVWLRSPSDKVQGLSKYTGDFIWNLITLDQFLKQKQ
jgi:asparagine synthetase B (glutamine-hydrolysing)